MADDPTDPAAETEVDPAEDLAADAGAETDAASAEPIEAEGDAAATPVDEEPTTGPAKAGTTKPAAAKASPAVVRKKVVSKRVTPKGAPQGVKVTPPKGSTPARSKGADGEDLGYADRYTAPEPKYAPGPSPWWVPAIMFGLLIVGALIIMLNYMGVFGDAENIRLVIGLAFILGGIIAATQYR
ncbi:cell division protein CrgA [Aquihabitans sp. G128]|uniref:cell division protein CrgA n=1 Tax=Aquihabitans sp. G128 TaxID=2849779 RepID=UPI001C24D398|nr:cell division protein CrgA [Aquihabitans sp. G128]QXC59727.1 cell division protein CrgA [Aquihabitans sp. G128]